MKQRTRDCSLNVATIFISHAFLNGWKEAKLVLFVTRFVSVSKTEFFESHDYRVCFFSSFGRSWYSLSHNQDTRNIENGTKSVKTRYIRFDLD